MLTVYLFCLFLIGYAYLFVPVNRPAVVTVETDAHAAIERGLDDLASGRAQYLGSFAEYADDEDLIHDIMLMAETSFEKVWGDDEPYTVAKEMPSTISELVITPEELAEMTAEAPATVPNYATMGCVELRAACSANGIKWRVRRAKGKGKGTYYHLSVAEMREALAGLG